MSTPNPSSAFPSTQQDLSHLAQTATDAAQDLGSAARVHASKMRGQLKDLAGHVREEGGTRLGEAKNQLLTVIDAARDLAVARPLSCIGVALAAGFLLGVARGSARRS